MRTRDLQALTFWLLGTGAILLLAGRVFDRWPFALTLAAAFNAWVLTRPRMIRVFRRLCGVQVERQTYFRD